MEDCGAVDRSLKALGIGLIVVAAAAVAAGCGGSTETEPPAAPPGRPQALPNLPSGWEAHRDRSIGYAIGIPPGWERREHRGSVLIRSPDHLVALSLAGDRGADALEVPLERFATEALAALPGFTTHLEPGRPRRFGGTPLDAVETTAKGMAKSSGIEERVTLLALRRDAVVNYTMAIVENARRPRSVHDRAIALRMVRTLRDQPVEPRAGATPPGRGARGRARRS
jgi:hypothetical protein